MHIKTMQDLDDFVRGSTLYGTGGGGPQTVGKELLLGSFEEGKDLTWVDIDTLDDEAYVCTAFYMGSIAPLSEADLERKQELGLDERKEERVLVRAVRELEKELDVEIAAIIPVELGGINSPAPVDAAVQMGKKVIDADLAGRAVPEIAQTLPRLCNYPIAPIICCDAWGNVTIIRETHGYDMAEQLGKMLSIPAFEPIGLACFTMKVKDAKNAIIKGTMTRNMVAGAAVREAVENGNDPAKAFAEVSDGYVLFKGDVTKKEWSNTGGYMIVDLQIQGVGNYDGHELKIWAKNENHLSWLDGEEYVMSPDLIQCIDAKSGEPLTNADIKGGDTVSVVGFKNEKYRTEEGIKLLGPYHFGFKHIEYVPIEKRVK